MEEHLKKEQFLETLKTNVEKLEKIHHIEILKILKKNPNIKLNENKNSIYINLSFVPEESILEIENYLNYVYDQEKTIMETEKVKEDMKKLLVPYDNIEQQPTTNKKHQSAYY
jgi:hypothetical protein